MEQNNTTEVETSTAEETAVENLADVETSGQDMEAYTPDDATIERAVRAGMSLTDIRQCPSKEFAEKMIGAFESKSAKPSTGGENQSDGGDFPVIDFGDFSIENGYDEHLVNAVNSLKSTVEAQAKVIAKLMASTSAKPSKAVETRKNLMLAKPGGEGGNKVSTPKNAEAEILAALRQKFKLN